MKYDEPKSGEWQQPIRRGYKLQCCDCGLVHTFDFKVKNNRVEFRCFRNIRSTAQVRRHFKSIRVIKSHKS